MSCARIRPSALSSPTVSTSRTGTTRAAIRPTASSTDIIGPPKAKQSSDNCAICGSALGFALGQYIVNRHRRPLHHGGNGLDIIEMGGRKRGFNGRVGCDPNHIGIVGKQQRLLVGGAMDLDLAVWLALEAFNEDEIDPRDLRHKFPQPRPDRAPP